MNIQELEQAVREWATNKELIHTKNAFKQMTKMQEEVEELWDEVAYEEVNNIKDEIGDVIVTCIVQASIWGLGLQECLESAYNKISKRKGDTVNGVFIKDEY